MDALIVYIDQTKKYTHIEPPAARKPRATLPSAELPGQRDWTFLLGAITKDGDQFFSRFEEYGIACHAKHFILNL